MNKDKTEFCFSNEPSLLPCPFCGKHPIISGSYGRVMVWCSGNIGDGNCWVSPRVSTYEGILDAITKWNKRM